MPPFTAPALSRQACAARCALYRVRIGELEERGAPEQTIREAKLDLAEAERVAKDAGGQTPGRLHLEVLSQGRANKRQEEAVRRSERTLRELQEKCDLAAAALEEGRNRHRTVQSKLDKGRQRYAFLVSQQAAESRPRAEANDVRNALAALKHAVAAMPSGSAEHLDVVGNALARFYPDKDEAKIVIDETGFAANSDTEVSSAGDFVDDEEEVTGDLLLDRKEARTELRAVERQRQEALYAAITEGLRGDEVLSDYAARRKQAAARAHAAEAALHRARELARARLRRGATEGAAPASAAAAAASEPPAWPAETGGGRHSRTQETTVNEQRDVGANKRKSWADESEIIPCVSVLGQVPETAAMAAHDTDATAMLEHEIPCPTPEQGRTAEDDDGEQDELIPCPPHPKWRRGEDECSEGGATVDETPVIGPCSPAAHPPASALPQPDIHTAASGTASRPAGPPSSPLAVMVADGAVRLAQATLNSRAASAERRRIEDEAARHGRHASSGVRWKKQETSPSRDGDDHSGARDRSPRRRSATGAAMEQG